MWYVLWKDFMISSEVHAFQRITWDREEREILCCHGNSSLQSRSEDSPWHLAISMLSKRSHDIPALCRISWFPATIHALCRSSWFFLQRSMPCGGWHETGSGMRSGSAMGSESEVLGSPRSKASTAHGKSLHRFKLDGTAWQYHHSHLDPCKPGLGGRRGWRGRRRTREGGGRGERVRGRESGD